MAAVIVTMSCRCSAIAMISSPKIFVQLLPLVGRARPVAGSKPPDWCIWSASSFSAGAYPRDHRAPLATDGIRLGETVGVGQRGRRVRVLDPVVRTLGAARVTGQPAALAQRRHLRHAPGEHLVDVGLVPDVEDDRFGR